MTLLLHSSVLIPIVLPILLIDQDLSLFLDKATTESKKKSPLFQILNNYNSKTSTFDIYNMNLGKLKSSLTIFFSTLLLFFLPFPNPKFSFQFNFSITLFSFDLNCVLISILLNINKYILWHLYIHFLVYYFIFLCIFLFILPYN